MRGHGLYTILDRMNASFQGCGVIQGEMYASGIPYVVEGDDDIHGEVYTLSKEQIRPIDAIEGGYERRETECVIVDPSVDSLNEGDVIPVQYYHSLYHPRNRDEYVASGRFSDHKPSLT